MKTAMTGEMALEALKKYNKELFHILHALTVKDVMHWFAQGQGYGGEKDFWGIADLLHDIDFEVYPEQHCVEAPGLLRETGTEDELIRAVYSHGYGLVADIKPEHQMEKILFASDELTGLIRTAARMRPSESTTGMEISSLKKKFKSKRFAAGRSRGVIRGGAGGLGWTLGELMGKTIRVMRPCEAAVGEEMKAYKT